MKGIFQLLVILGLITCFTHCIRELEARRQPKMYSGTISSVEYVVAENKCPHYRAYFYCPEIRKDIEVRVSPREASRLKKGDKVSYSLSAALANDDRPIEVIYGKTN